MSLLTFIPYHELVASETDYRAVNARVESRPRK